MIAASRVSLKSYYTKHGEVKLAGQHTVLLGVKTYDEENCSIRSMVVSDWTGGRMIEPILLGTENRSLAILAGF